MLLNARTNKTCLHTSTQLRINEKLKQRLSRLFTAGITPEKKTNEKS